MQNTGTQPMPLVIQWQIRTAISYQCKNDALIRGRKSSVKRVVLKMEIVSRIVTDATVLIKPSDTTWGDFSDRPLQASKVHRETSTPLQQPYSQINRSAIQDVCLHSPFHKVQAMP